MMKAVSCAYVRATAQALSNSLRTTGAAVGKQHRVKWEIEWQSQLYNVNLAKNAKVCAVHNNNS